MTAYQEILFSVITPTFNRAGFISSAIESVIAQSYTNWELIIIDDGSTDNTAKIISQYSAKDSRIRYFKQENRGRSVARNFGIDRAKGHYICFLDDDDYYLDCFLIEFYREITKRNSPEAVFICRELTEESGRIIKYDRNIEKYTNNPALAYFRYPGVMKVCTHKNIFFKFRFDDRFNIGEDSNLFTKVVLYFPSFFINKYLCVCVNHSARTMAGELRDTLFFNDSYNRLNALEDIYSGYYMMLKEKGLLKEWYRKYLKIAYFFSSAALKQCRFKNSINYLIKMKWKYNIIIIYYFNSIIFRIPFYWFKCIINKIWIKSS